MGMGGLVPIHISASFHAFADVSKGLAFFEGTHLGPSLFPPLCSSVTDLELFVIFVELTLGLVETPLKPFLLFVVPLAFLPRPFQSPDRLGQFFLVLLMFLFGSLKVQFHLRPRDSLADQCGLDRPELFFRRLELGEGFAEIDRVVVLLSVDLFIGLSLSLRGVEQPVSHVVHVPGSGERMSVSYRLQYEKGVPDNVPVVQLLGTVVGCSR